MNTPRDIRGSIRPALQINPESRQPLCVHCRIEFRRLNDKQFYCSENCNKLAAKQRARDRYIERKVETILAESPPPPKTQTESARRNRNPARNGSGTWNEAKAEAYMKKVTMPPSEYSELWNGRRDTEAHCCIPSQSHYHRSES